MGKLSRHRKLKACDPFNTKVKKEDPDDETKVIFTKKADESLPRSLKNMMKSQAEIERTGTFDYRQVLDEGENTSSGSKIKSKTKAKLLNIQRKDGESLMAFNRRVDEEASKVMAIKTEGAKRTRLKRKEFLEKRREKLQQTIYRANNQDSDGKPLKDFNTMKDVVKFGEVVQQPPRLTVKPRIKPTQQLKKSSLLLQNIVDGKGADADSTKKKKILTPAAQSRLEIERQKAIEGYRALKKTPSAYTSFLNLQPKVGLE